MSAPEQTSQHKPQFGQSVQLTNGEWYDFPMGEDEERARQIFTESVYPNRRLLRFDPAIIDEFPRLPAQPSQPASRVCHHCNEQIVEGPSGFWSHKAGHACCGPGKFAIPSFPEPVPAAPTEAEKPLDDDFRPSKLWLSNAEIRSTGMLCGGAVANIARELLELRAKVYANASPSPKEPLPKSQGLCETTNTERFEQPHCLCPTYEGNLGPCARFEEGSNGNCVYCDHLLSCHLLAWSASVALNYHIRERQLRDLHADFLVLASQQKERSTR
jgi:hypothetical protein